MSASYNGDDSDASEEFHLYKTTKAGYDKVLEKWSTIYGPNSTKFAEYKENVEKSVVDFWEQQFEVAEGRQKALVSSIEKMGKEAVELEKILDLDQNMMSFNTDIPLVEVEEELWKLLERYRVIRDEQLAYYNTLLDQEKELCNILDVKPQIPLLMVTESADECSSIPRKEDIQRFENLIRELQHEEDKLKFEFDENKIVLQSLLKECGVLPFTKVERAAALDDGTDFPPTAQNLKILKKSVESYTTEKKNMMEQADALREDILKISKKMMKDEKYVNDLLSQCAGFSKPTITKLKEKLESLKEERKGNLKDLILQHRTLLDDLWTRCCYSDHQRALFRPYHVDYYTEDVLGLHELEVENLEMYYNQNKKIFILAQKHKELWARLLHLEELAADTQRLFTNRGGKLLQEEKERKTIQKKLPAIKAELVTLLNEYKARTGNEFMLCGSPLLDMLERLEEEREELKETQKKVRKAVNTETVLLESRLGSRPVPNKRKIPTPQINTTTKIMKMTQSSANSTASTASYKSASSNRGLKVFQANNPTGGLAVPSSSLPRVGVGAAAGTYAMLHTPSKQMGGSRTPAASSRTPAASSHAPAASSHAPAASTPENGSPSYESFQEHLEKSIGKKTSCRSSTKNTERVLRPRNLNTTVTKIQRMTPYKTPVKTPTRIPFRCATGGKIPSIVPPISPRSGTKFTTPRNKLPIIF